MARVVVTGATGTLGRALVAALETRGDTAVVLSRDPARAHAALGPRVEAHGWPDPLATAPPAAALEGTDAVVNLLGEPIAQRWTAAAKRAIHDSRVLGTRSLVAAVCALSSDVRPRTLVSGSATGIYGPRGDESLDESAATGSDFLARVVVAWEREALAAAPQMRVVLARTGVVLAARGGALASMLPFFRLGLGGPVAGGRQYVPWIHIDDVVGAVLHSLDGNAEGPLNVTAPQPATNRELSRALGRVLGRPAIMPVPALALRALYGEMATVVTTGQRAVPARLRERGYAYRYSELEPALRDVVG